MPEIGQTRPSSLGTARPLPPRQERRCRRGGTARPCRTPTRAARAARAATRRPVATVPRSTSDQGAGDPEGWRLPVGMGGPARTRASRWGRRRASATGGSGGDITLAAAGVIRIVSVDPRITHGHHSYRYGDPPDAAPRPDCISTVGRRPGAPESTLRGSHERLNGRDGTATPGTRAAS